MSLEMSPYHSALALEPPSINRKPILVIMSTQSINRLRPYQREVARAILSSVFGRKGLTFSVVKAAP